MKPMIHKFGGASLRDATSIRNAGALITRLYHPGMVLVVSALGKTTNELEQIAGACFRREPQATELVLALQKKHADLARELLPPPALQPLLDALHNTLVEIDWVMEEERREHYDYVYDQIVSLGEMLSTRLLAAYLQHLGLPVEWTDARDLIRTDNNYREARIDWTLTRELTLRQYAALKPEKIMLTQGFVGGTSENFSTTLGREGSDYSAAILAYCLGAGSVTIWKDVDGVLNADPRYFPNTAVIPELTYHEAIEMTFYGATVIHPKTIKPLQNSGIPLYVKSFVHPEEPGTCISAAPPRAPLPPMLVLKTMQTLLSISPRDFSFIEEENLSYIFSCFARHQVRVHLMQHAAISFSACVEGREPLLYQCLQSLSERFRVLRNDEVQLLTIRHYTEPLVMQYTGGKEVLLEQKTRGTGQWVMKKAL